jgi:hypothetical protein
MNIKIHSQTGVVMICYLKGKINIKFNFVASITVVNSAVLCKYNNCMGIILYQKYNIYTLDRIHLYAWCMYM